MRSAALLLLIGLTAVSAQAQTDAPEATVLTDSLTAAEVDLKARRASFYSLFVPGSGHMTAGETGKGVAILGLAVGVPVGTALATGVSSFECTSGRGCDTVDGKTALFLTAVAVGFTAYLYGWLDADDAVRRQAAASRVQAAPTVVTGASGVAPGVSLRMRL